MRCVVATSCVLAVIGCAQDGGSDGAPQGFEPSTTVPGDVLSHEAPGPMDPGSVTQGIGGAPTPGGPIPEARPDPGAGEPPLAMMMGSAGMAGSEAPAADAGDGASCAQRVQDSDGVVLLGDSWWALTSVHPMLEENTGSRYTRAHYVSGVSMTFDNAFGPTIPTQYDAARLAGPIKTVIMDGGGNDVLLHPQGALVASPCYGSITPECMRTIEDVVATYDELLLRMEADGVQDVIVFYYGYLPDSNYDAVMDLGAELGSVPCLEHPACHFVDMREAFRGHEIEYIGIDGIHPTPAGSQVIADAIAEVLARECVQYY